MPEQTPAMPADGRTGGRRPRRRYFTGDARRPWRVCRFARPVDWSAEVGYCRCGSPLEPTTQSRTGWRHKAARRRELAAVVHNDRAPELALSEVVPAPAPGRDDNIAGSPHGPRELPVAVGSDAAIAYAIADHLSIRAAGAIVDPFTPTARSLRASFVLDALAKARRCPLCAPVLAGRELEAARRG